MVAVCANCLATVLLAGTNWTWLGCTAETAQVRRRVVWIRMAIRIRILVIRVTDYSFYARHNDTLINRVADCGFGATSVWFHNSQLVRYAGTRHRRYVSFVIHVPLGSSQFPSVTELALTMARGMAVTEYM